ncbi:hypothetical protein AALP_AA3G081500 [Arabis alpina]|uniref:Uncharacterized protein n=1 Tax=Arabis alpina TaxID=50452 RepID=A0A087H7U2_ARAAL|nr:hypothetical protein AALP_AA3G081500 [Arabis alpina]
MDSCNSDSDPPRRENQILEETIDNSVIVSLLTASEPPTTQPPSLLSIPAPQATIIEGSVSNTNSDYVVTSPTPEIMSSFVPSLGAWGKPLKIPIELKDPIPQDPPLVTSTSRINANPISDILPPELKENGQLRNLLAALDSGDYSGYEMGVASQKTKGGRSIKPTQKVQEMQWTKVRGRGKRGRGSRGNHDQPC